MNIKVHNLQKRSIKKLTKKYSGLSDLLNKIHSMGLSSLIKLKHHHNAAPENPILINPETDKSEKWWFLGE